MSRAILNIRVVSMTGGRKAISPPGHHITKAAATYVPFTRSSSSSSSSSSARIRRRTEQEERKHRDNRRSHQVADILGLAWDPELEPDFRGPLWKSTAASAKKNQSEKKDSGDSGASGLAEDESTTMEESSAIMEVGSNTSLSSGGDSSDVSSGGREA